MLGIVTLLYSLDYLPGTLTLAFQLQKLLASNGEDKKLCLLLSEHLVQENCIPDSTLDVLQDLFDEIIEVRSLDFNDPVVIKNRVNLSLLGNRGELAFTFMKFHLWKLTQYDKVLFLDSDVLPLDSDLFEIFSHVENQTSDQIAAVPDCGWPDLFNSGVLVIKPSIEKFEELEELASEELSIDGADQGILNQFFNPLCHDGERITEWVKLPFFYNVTVPGAGYQYSPALKFFAKKLKLVHFIGKNKPWRNEGNAQIFSDKYRNQWWSLYMELCQKYFQSDLDIDIDQLCRVTEKTNIKENIPHSRWDPAREPPPKDLPAEGSGLKFTTNYEWESELLVLPESPSKDTSKHDQSIETKLESEPMVPISPDVLERKSTPRIKPIFPWESDSHYRASRVFPDELE